MDSKNNDGYKFSIFRDYLCCIIIHTTYMLFISTSHGKCCLSILSMALFGSQYNKIQYNTTQYTKKESTLKIINC